MSAHRERCFFGRAHTWTTLGGEVYLCSCGAIFGTADRFDPTEAGVLIRLTNESKLVGSIRDLFG